MGKKKKESNDQRVLGDGQRYSESASASESKSGW